MKKIFNLLVNILPFAVWIVWFFMALFDKEIIIDLGTLELILLSVLPLIYSVYNLIFSADKKNFVIQNGIFLMAQVVGYYTSGRLYYNFISNDSGTTMIINIFSGISIVYIVILTLVGYGIKAFIEKLRKR